MPWFDERGIEEVGLFDVRKAYSNKTLMLPLYQRNAVWSEGRICALWDSLLRGFPLPSFFLTRGNGTSRRLSENGVIGTVIEKIENKYFDVLDGQQRLAAIIAGIEPNPSIRLWIDLAPPSGAAHPLRFNYWLHPCTKIFPFGFHMLASGEHDFEAPSDRTLREIWRAIQPIGDLQGKDYYQLPLGRTFPWEAKCPVPLADCLGLCHLRDLELALEIRVLVREHQQAMHIFNRPTLTEDEIQALDLAPLTRGLRRVKNAKLALQLICLENIIEQGEGEYEDVSYEIFQRIGRGGVSITPRQLAVSKLMLMLGKPGHDALAGFQRSYYGQMIEAEDVIHALTRVALASALANNPVANNHETADDCDMLHLSAGRLHTIKSKHAEIWTKTRK